MRKPCQRKTRQRILTGTPHPGETICRIRAILDDLGLCMHETEWHDVDRRAYSLSIAASDFSLPRRQRAFGANGKGTSVELAARKRLRGIPGASAEHAPHLFLRVLRGDARES